jgi:hypothetical protein
VDLAAVVSAAEKTAHTKDDAIFNGFKFRVLERGTAVYLKPKGAKN